MSLVLLTLRSVSGCTCMPVTLHGSYKSSDFGEYCSWYINRVCEIFFQYFYNCTYFFLSRNLGLTSLKVEQNQMDDPLKPPANTDRSKNWLTSFFAVLVGRVIYKTPEYKDETQNYLNGNTDYDVEVLRVLKQVVYTSKSLNSLIDHCFCDFDPKRKSSYNYNCNILL